MRRLNIMHRKRRGFVGLLVGLVVVLTACGSSTTDDEVIPAVPTVVAASGEGEDDVSLESDEVVDEGNESTDAEPSDAPEEITSGGSDVAPLPVELFAGELLRLG